MSDGFHIRKLPLDFMDWMERAACRERQVDPDWFFPENNSGNRSAANNGALLAVEKIAKAVCLRCPVMETCLDYQMDKESEGHTNTHGVGDGIWGGTTPRERRRVYRAAGDREEARQMLLDLVTAQGDNRTAENPLGLGLMGRKV